MSRRYTSKNPIVKKELQGDYISWFNSKPAKRPGDGLEPLKYDCEPKKRSTSPTNKGTKKLQVSPIVVPEKMKTKKYNKTKKGGRKLRKTNKKSKKGIMKKMRMKAGTKKSITSL